jgi:glycosyltransferase involved in cell wall biosynthesis
MNLAIASPSAPAYSETFIHMQTERLPCRLRIYGEPVAGETMPGGPIQPLRSLRGLLDTAYWCGLKQQRWEGPQAAELKRRIKKNHIEVLLANYGLTGVALLPVCRALSIPLVVHFHGYDAHLNSVIKEQRESYQRLGGECAGIIVVSHRMQAALTGLGMPAEKMTLARCGVDPDRFEAKTEFPATPVFFGVGRFVDKKAPYLSLLAFKKVHERFPASRLILAGDGILLETTRNLAKVLKLETAVEFPGVLAPEQVAAYMRSATAFVQHSITPEHGPASGDSEGTPVAVLEAMMTGLPVIGTRHAGIGEVIQDGVTGYVVAERDVESMADAMLRVASSTQNARQLGQAAREYAMKNNTAEIYLNKLKSVLESAVQSNSSR